MPIKIHWGSNGSYKSSGALQDDVIPELKRGRVVITNVSGFTLDSVKAVYSDIPDTAEVINLPLDKAETMLLLRFVLYWAPVGALIIFDETQLIFSKRWSAKQVLDMFGHGEIPIVPETVLECRTKYEHLNRAYDSDDKDWFQVDRDDYPINWDDSWTRHRHWNWDIVLTTPNIKMVRDDIRETSEIAVRHVNLALLGFGGRYKEAMHDAQKNQPDVKAITEIKRIKPDVFRTYKSTRTGIVTDTGAGKSIFKSVPLLIALAFCITSFGYAISTGGFDYFIENSGDSGLEKVAEANRLNDEFRRENGLLVPENDHSETVSVPNDPVPNVVNNKVLIVDGVFSGSMIYVLGSITGQNRVYYLFEIQPEGRSSFQMTSKQLAYSGYLVASKGSCAAELTPFEGGLKGESFTVTCGRMSRQSGSMFAGI